MFLVAMSPLALAYEIAPFECCHVEDVELARAPLSVTVVPVADRRGPLLNHPEAAAKWAELAGIVRGGYGNPWNLWAGRDMRDYVTDALVAQLVAAGHTVELAQDVAPRPGAVALGAAELASAGRGAELVVHGTLNEWEVDIGAYGTRKVKADLELFAVNRAGKKSWSGHLQLNDHSEGLRLLGENEYTDRAREWYGRVGFKYLETAVVESGLIALFVGLEIDHAGGGPPVSPAAARSSGEGCGKDTDCKGSRICTDGKCVSP